MELPWGEFFLTAAFLLVGISARYFIVAGGAYVLVWKWGRARFETRRIHHVAASFRQIRREIIFSILSSLVFALIGSYLFLAWQRGETRLYQSVDEYGYLYLILSLPLLLFLHDTYFYWVHRLMHTRWLFARAHLIHHESRSPTPWAAFSFHPFEALLEAAIFPALILLLPIHVGILILFLTLMTLSSVVNHLGYEFFPRQTPQHPVLKWFITATHHQLHHREVKCNFGLYFTFWDQWVATGHRGYERLWERVVPRPKRDRS